MPNADNIRREGPNVYFLTRSFIVDPEDKRDSIENKPKVKLSLVFCIQHNFIDFQCRSNRWTRAEDPNVTAYVSRPVHAVPCMAKNCIEHCW